MRTRSLDPASSDRPRSADSNRRDGDAAALLRKEARTLGPVEPSSGESSARSSLDQSGGAADNIPGPRKSGRPASKSPAGHVQLPASRPDSPSKGEKSADMGYGSNRRKRPRGAWYCSPITLVATVFSALCALTVLRSFLTRQLDPVGCSMSYMRPAFAKFADFSTEHTRFASKYSLYLYREGGIDDDTRVKGVPVLFIPGNAGSYKQVRPLAAEAAVHYHNVLQHDPQARAAGKRPLDFFSVDFNEDITAFHGQTLLDQAEYLNEAISYILSLYHNPGQSLRDADLPDPTSVLVVGHSMGGIVARTMLILPNYQSNSINTIVTLSAPHARAPVSFDADIVRTYQRINDYWRQAYSQKWANNNPLWHVTLISIAGGGLDTVVPSDYSTIASLVPPTHGFTVFTSSIPEVWTGMDHLAITWCNQLRKSVVLSLYDVIDAGRPSQTRPRAERMTSFKHRFLTGMEAVAERTLPQKEPKTLLTLEDNSNAIVPQGERLVVRELGRAGKPKPYLLPIPPSSGERKIFTLMTDQKLSESGGSEPVEVLFCSVFPLQSGQSSSVFSMNMDLSGGSSGSTRLACKNAASDTILLPSSRKDNHLPFDNYLEKDWNVLVGRSPPFAYLQYDLETLAEHQFVAIVDKAQHPMPGWILAEFSSKADALVQADKTLSDMISSGLDITLAKKTMMTEIKIPSVHSSLLAYHLSINKQPCGENAELFAPLLRQYISEPYESKWFVNVKDVDISMHGVAPYIPPALKDSTEAQGLTLQIWADPTCNSPLAVSMRVDLLGSLGKLWMRYRTALAAFPLLVVALVLRKQFQVHDQHGVFISFSEAMDLCLRTSVPLLLVALTLLGVSFPRMSRNAGYANGLSDVRNGTETVIDYTRNDLLLGSQDPFFCLLIPLFGLVSVGVCIGLNYVMLGVTYTMAFVTSSLAKLMYRNTDRSNASLAVTPVVRRIIITVALLLLVSTVIPYQFVFIVLCVVQLATCIRALSLAKDTFSAAHFHFYNYAHSILLLLLWILPINIPTLVVWIHNLAVHWLTPFSSHHNVFSIMPYVLLVETLSTGRMIPRVTSWIRHATSILLFILAVFAAMYGVTYAYLLHHIVNLLCVWLIGIYLSESKLSGLPKSITSLFGTGRRTTNKKQP